MLGQKGMPNGKFGQKGSPAHGMIGGLHKSVIQHAQKKAKEMVAQTAKYGSLEKK